MPLQLAVFLALVFLVLLMNTAVLWFVHRQVRRAATQAARRESRITESLGALKDGLVRMGDLSDDGIRWSGAALDRTREIGAVFDAAEDRLRYGLESVDFSMSLASQRVDKTSEVAQAAVRERADAVAAAAHGTAALLELMSYLLGRVAGTDRPEYSDQRKSGRS